MPTAFLIDGEFFLRRHQFLRGRKTPKQVAIDLFWMCTQHLRRDMAPPRLLYRIFFYDCPPLTKKVHNPISRSAVDLAKTPTALWRNEFHNELRRGRKTALRLGYLNERGGNWVIKPDVQQRLFRREAAIDDLSESDVRYVAPQKGVDMRIGLDIASLAFKRQVDQIVLITGDSDFVPAAKLARREGIDLVLDPMWANIRHDLHEHIDGLRSVFTNKQKDSDPFSQEAP